MFPVVIYSSNIGYWFVVYKLLSKGKYQDQCMPKVKGINISGVDRLSEYSRRGPTVSGRLHFDRVRLVGRLRYYCSCGWLFGRSFSVVSLCRGIIDHHCGITARLFKTAGTEAQGFMHIFLPFFDGFVDSQCCILAMRPIWDVTSYPK